MKQTLLHGDCLERLKELPDNSVDAVVTDPPYGLSFMGKKWDYDVPSEDVWRECLRVLKPGGHLLAFAGTRTQHRMAVNIEDAGFEIRDMIAWVYGSGFPKSHDVSKAIDKMDAAQAQQARRYRFTEWVRSQGVTSRQIDDATGTNMGVHYTTLASQPAIMTREHLDACRHLFRDVPAWVEREANIRSVESKNYAAREVVGVQKNAMSGWDMDGGTKFADRNITAPATEAAKQWQGWGTALKPALEPITVARKPLEGTVAANVLEHGTGALNIDGCRVPGALGGDPNRFTKTDGGEIVAHLHDAPVVRSEGRWPANVIHDGSDEVVAGFPSEGRSTKPSRTGTAFKNDGLFMPGQDRRPISHNDNGGSAARFFYCAKASKRDRDEGLDGFRAAKRQGNRPCSPDETGKFPDHDHRERTGNFHPTVKPTALMRYLCRLVTPPGGTVLDPFMGSGSTGKAAMLEGFQFIGIERESEYLEIAKARIEHAEKQKGAEEELPLVYPENHQQKIEG